VAPGLAVAERHAALPSGPRWPVPALRARPLHDGAAVSRFSPRQATLPPVLSRLAVFVSLVVVTLVRQPTAEQRFVGFVAGAMGLWCSVMSFWRPRWAIYRYLVLAGWLLFCTLATRGPDAIVCASHATSALAIAAFSILEAHARRPSDDAPDP
jgi:hypothetical protein